MNKFFADRKIVTLLMDLKSQVQVLAHQQQQILAQLSKNGSTGGSKAAPKLPDGVVLPLDRMEQVTSLERRLTRSPEDKHMLVKCNCRIKITVGFCNWCTISYQIKYFSVFSTGTSSSWDLLCAYYKQGFR